MADQFLYPIPQKFLEDKEVTSFMVALIRTLDDLLRPEGAIATSEATTATVLTQQQKLDLMTISQAVNLDTVEAQAQAATTAISVIQSNSPDYSISNDGTVRVFSADGAAGTISATPTQAEVENIRDAVLVQGDVIATVIRDLIGKDIFA